MQAVCKKCFVLLREISDYSFKICTLPNNAGNLLVKLVFNMFSSAGVILPFFRVRFVFSVVAESESLSGVLFNSESSSSAPSSRFFLSLPVFLNCLQQSFWFWVFYCFLSWNLLTVSWEKEGCRCRRRTYGTSASLLLLSFELVPYSMTETATLAFLFITNCSSSRVVKCFSLLLYIKRKNWCVKTGWNFINVKLFIFFVYYESLWLFKKFQNLFCSLKILFVHEL